MARTTAFDIAYGAARALRVAWFAGQYVAAERLTRGARGPVVRGDRPAAPAAIGWRPILRAVADLFARDRAMIAAGVYAVPADLALRPGKALADARRFFRDLPEVARRRREHGHAEVREAAPPGAYPAYYLQNFHYQTDGWLSDHSAAVYDHQVEVLFTGAAAAMRRQALPLLRQVIAGRDTRRLHVADIACGTGGLIADMKATWPRLHVTGLDLSPAYLRRARRR
ncbi:MAG: class I SAM-dependent methyltransferase, partial [Zavarzinia sp.]|nr:class I SAM-dependent methyltransferase [Zavarzinia sp.]